MNKEKNEISLSIAIVGATGLVGSTLLSLLQEDFFSFNFSKIFLVASEQSVGKTIKFRQTSLPVYDLAHFDFHQTKLAFFCVGNELAAKYIPIATAAGNIVIDKSNYYRQHPDVPLIIPEVNPASLSLYTKMNIIANPNCNTIPVSVALKPIYDAVGIKRINVATYQSVSGTGKDAINELIEQTKQVLNHEEPIPPQVYPKPIAFNVLPQIDIFLENGYTAEEMKMILEIQKIFDDKQLMINATAVRVPVFCGHSAAVNIETKDKLTAKLARKLLAHAPGIQLSEDEFDYPTPIEAAGLNAVFVGRIREDISHPQGLNMWVVADNLRKGAALNALQITQCLIEEGIF